MWTKNGLSRTALATSKFAWPSPQRSTGLSAESMKKSGASPNYFHLHLVSDATGETLLAVGRAAAAQYATVSPIEHVYPLVRNQKQLDAALSEIEQNPGIVLYTMVDRDLAGRIDSCLLYTSPSPRDRS